VRLNPQQIETIHQATEELTGADTKISLFGSRVDDNARGGDIDLLVEIMHPVDEPVWLTAMLSGRISRMLGGQKVDVVLMAPNIKRFPIHEIAQKEGIAL